MSGMKNSPFGKRLRASHQEGDESPRKSRQRMNSLFGVGPADPTPALDARAPSPDAPFGPQSSPRSLATRSRDYGDRFVPSRDGGDIRTTFHLLEEGGPSTPSKNRIIPSESDAQKGMYPIQLHGPGLPEIRASELHVQLDIGQRSDTPLPRSCSDATRPTTLNTASTSAIPV